MDFYIYNRGVAVQSLLESTFRQALITTTLEHLALMIDFARSLNEMQEIIVRLFPLCVDPPHPDITVHDVGKTTRIYWQSPCQDGDTHTRVGPSRTPR